MEADPTPTPTPRRRRALMAGVLALAGLAIAVPAAGALAGDGDSNGGPAATQRGDGARDKRDCPEHERGGGEREDNSASDSFDESSEL